MLHDSALYKFKIDKYTDIFNTRLIIISICNSVAM